MRIALCLASCGVVALAACGGASRDATEEVVLAPIRAPIVEVAEARPFACTIRGDGEPLSGNEDGDYPLFIAQGDMVPSAVVVRKDWMPAAWSHLPPVGARGHLARARVDLAGQGVSMSAWTPIGDHVFQLRERSPVAAEHLWAHANDTGRILGVEGTDVLFEIETGIDEPKTLTARARCEHVAYERNPPGAVDDPAPGGGELALPAASVLELFADARAEEALVRVGAPEGKIANLRRWEQAGSRVRVTGSFGSRFGFDAWAPAEQVGPVPPAGGRLGGSHRTKPPFRTFCRTRVASRDAVVARVTDLWVAGADVSKRYAIGKAEAGAHVSVMGETSDFAHVVFDTVAIAPPEGEHFYLRSMDLTFADPQ